MDQFIRRLSALIVLAVLASASAVTVAASPASAAALTAVGWSVSKPHPGDTGVRYTWNFTTSTTAVIDSVTFTVPAGTTETGLSVVDVFGIGSGTVDLTGTTVTYHITGPASVAGGVSILVSVDGFTNTATVGPYSSTETTLVGVGAIDTAASNNVTIGANTTQVLVQVAQVTAFTLDTVAFALLVDPSVPALADRSKAVGVTVATNASGGYTLSTSIDHQLTGVTHGGDTVAAASAGRAVGFIGVALPVNSFGYGVAVAGVGTVQGAGFAGGGIVGYTAAPGDVVVAATAPTNGDAITFTNRVRVDYAQPADTYTATVTYTVTPTY
jgi:hypothetical protein